MREARWVVVSWLALGVACSGADGASGSGDGSGDGAGDGSGAMLDGGGRGGRGDAGPSGGGDGSGDGVGTDGGADGGSGGSVPVADPGAPAVARGGDYFGFTEHFNRYYTDDTWTPSSIVYVSANGSGDGSTHDAPATVQDALDALAPGTQVVFLAGDYADVCFQVDADHDGTRDAPVVLYAERKQDGSRGVHMTCCGTGRQTCINLEGASHVAVDGFIFEGGRYGLRSVGLDYAASGHTEGNALLNSEAFDQTNDGVLTGASDWFVVENDVVHRSGAGDGHGIYLSNGSDFNVVRFNDLYDNAGATFQINADPNSCCGDEGIAFDSPECDALAGSGGEGGRGVSDYMLIDSNYFHHGTAQGSNFTSVRYSVVRNNIFAFWNRHGVSFWSEPDGNGVYNPNLGSHHNRVLHNLFVTTGSQQAVQFIAHSGDNTFANNVVLATNGGVWMETDDTVANNTYDGNFYIAGSFDGRTSITASEHQSDTFDPSWFASFPSGLPSKATDLAPSASAPWLDLGTKLADVPLDLTGKQRKSPTDLGPFER